MNNRIPNKRDIIEFMENRKKKSAEEKLKREIESKERAEKLIQNLRELNSLSNQLATKKIVPSRISSKTSKIKQLIYRKEIDILGK